MMNSRCRRWPRRKHRIRWARQMSADGVVLLTMNWEGADVFICTRCKQITPILPEKQA